MRRWLLPLLFILPLLGGCGETGPTFHAKSIEGLMPPLEYRLTGQDGRPTTEADFSGKVRAVFFGFTNCPDVCPTTLSDLRKAVGKLSPEEREAIQILFVSVDPNRDSPERLEKYTGFYGDNIFGMTGPEKRLRELSKRYRTTFGYGKENADGNYEVSHSGAVYVFDRNGEVRLLMRNDLSPKQMAEDFRGLLEHG